MANANLLAILVAAASGFMVGGLWYGPLFGKAWQSEIGLSDDEIKSGNMAKIFGITFLFSVLSAVFLGHLLAHFDTDLYRTMMISTGIAIGFVAPAIGTNYLYGRKSGKLFAIDAGYWIVFYAAMGLVFGLLGA
ncbi:DUF1761 domain-containing protein [Sphingorhabdus pulchriflava]|uniref:DUF1761 domain-containing protein n=1 Tax=Sphingorhabdus pulchriflava TaxID=2292257 RepID=A0A371BJ21_9SPHN|nr:DUF1761 domain-containing protein [Sphingorhabdus pulchriflava]RDV07537.1 DUF1761 domain-containing protein [Sphingorhabdus pulchriflava]